MIVCVREIDLREIYPRDYRNERSTLSNLLYSLNISAFIEYRSCRENFRENGIEIFLGQRERERERLNWIAMKSRSLAGMYVARSTMRLHRESSPNARRRFPKIDAGDERFRRISIAPEHPPA